MQFIFWLSLFLVFYTFFGYGIVLYLLVKIRRIIKGKRALEEVAESQLPTLTLIIAAYNEESIINEKIANTLSLDYPAGKITYLIITDGSSDATPDKVALYPEIVLMHSPERKGKINAIHRAMEQVTSEVVVFTDANTFLNREALINIAKHYADAKVGAVSGEKRVQITNVSDATAGEGFYWKYESKLKEWDSELHSVVGAAGELFSIKTELYVPVKPDTILDDFMLSMLIAQNGYRIVYEPLAYATEGGSADVSEELKRKVRIAAGGIQSILRLKKMFNLFLNPVLSFQYISHRVLRWTITPFLLIISFILNGVIALQTRNVFYITLFILQILFYLAALSGWLFERKQIKVKILFIPYYFCMMNYAVAAGIHRYFFGNQSAAWDKARRR